MRVFIRRAKHSEPQLDLVKIRMALRRLAALKGDTPCDWSVPSREKILRFLGSG